ncbi:MAG: ketopantoate reductase family protein [Thermoplasmataceae archaeon]
MKILIIGTGSVGGFLGYKLINSDQDVSFLVREHRKDEVDRKGITIIQDGKASNIKVRTISSVTGDDHFDVVFISVRNYDLESLKSSLLKLNEKGSKFISLLNGIRHIDYLIPLVGIENLIGGSVSMETRRDKDGNIIYISQKPTITVGTEFSANLDIINEIEKTLRKAGFDVQLKSNVFQSVWEKYLFNLACNMTAVLSATVKEIKNNDCAIASTINLVNEAFLVSRRIGVGLGSKSRDLAIRKFLEMRDDFRSILAEDVLNNRSNESEFLFGYLGKLCENNRMNCPTIKLSCAVLKAMSRKSPL